MNDYEALTIVLSLAHENALSADMIDSEEMEKQYSLQQSALELLYLKLDELGAAGEVVLEK